MKLTNQGGTWRVAQPDVPPELALLVERIKIALGAMTSAPPMDGGGTYEQRRAHAAAQHLEFEIEPLIQALDLDVVITQIAEAAIAAHIEATKPRTATRDALPLNTGQTRCMPGDRVTISASPVRAAFLPERLVIANQCGAFMIHDIRIGVATDPNFGQPLTADIFAPNNPTDINPPLSMPAVQVGQDFVLVVEYTGDDPTGMPFYASVIGRAADQPAAGPPMPPLPPAPILNPMTGGDLDSQQALAAAWQSIIGATPGAIDDSDDDEEADSWDWSV